VDRQETDDEDTENQQRMVFFGVESGSGPIDQLSHQSGRVEGTRRSEDHTEAAAGVVERFDAGREALGVTTVPRVRFGVLQQDPV
jgi:hypothetical protein